MRINGFEQIKGFYSWAFNNQVLNVRTTHIALYMFLVNQNNRNSWVEWFKCPFDLAMGGSGITNKNTYYKTLNDLQEWNLIQYKKGVNNYKAPLIKLEVLFDTSTVPQSEPQVKPQSIPLPEPLLKPQLANNIKLLTNNLELITNNINKVIDFLNDDDFKEDDKQLNKEQRTKEFDLFWDKYPKKTAKKKCFDKFLKLKDEEVNKILNTIDDFINYKPFDKYTHPNPITYINQERWNDEIPKKEDAFNFGNMKVIGRTNQV